MTNVGEIHTAAGQLALCWTGNAGWLMGTGGLLIGIDLDLRPDGSRLAEPAISAEDVAPRLSALFVTHGHGDHFNPHTCRVLAQKSGCLFVLPANCTDAAAEMGIPDRRIRVAAPRRLFELLGIHVAPQRAIHGRRDFTVYQGANLDDCGYLLTIGGKKVFHPGDSVLLADHLELGHLDVLFISPTEHNMHIERAAFLIESLQPEHVFPQHYGTYRITDENRFWTQGYPDELEAALSETMRARYHKLDEGAVFVVQ